MAKKLTSRKFILAVLSAVGGVAISLSQLGGKTAIICAVISAILPPVTYIITEGVIDARAVHLITEAIDNITDSIGEEAHQDAARP